MDLDPSTAPAVAAAAAATEDYRSAPVPDSVAGQLGQGLFDFAHLPYTSKSVLAGALPPASDPEEVLSLSWKAAQEAGALRFYDDKVIFPLYALRSDGKTPIEISIRKGDPERSAGKPWHICYVNTYVNPHAGQPPLVPSKAIEQFAWLGPWEEFLEQLAATALPEMWDFNGRPDRHGHRFAILKSYLCTTFYRLSTEGKVLISDDRSFAAFNTGLFDKRYDDICACFEPSQGTLPWKFCGFAASGNRALKKKVAKHFNPLPQVAQYFDKPEDLLFNLNRVLIIDHDHILLDNISRLPLAFLEDEARNVEDALEVIRAIRLAEPAERGKLYEELADIVDTDTRLFRQLQNRLEDAVDLAKRRVRWNFKTAIPSYHPRRNSMCLLLPLCLSDEFTADAALVVDRLPSGNYQGQTTLTMEQAYMNARLICRPDSDWLTTTSCPASLLELDA